MAKQSGKMESLVTLQQFSSVFKSRKVFITGHTGFKGSWLLALLHLCGANVKGYALEPEYENGLYQLLKPLSIVHSVINDIRDQECLKKELLSFQPDFIFHLAAQPLVRRSYEKPAETFHINVAGTANLLEAVRALAGPCTVVVITTDKVYENKELDVLYQESDTLGGYDPYSASKACTELVVSSFRNSFFHPSTYEVHRKSIAIARAGNVIGGGDWSSDRILPDIVRSLLDHKFIGVRNPNAVRPWQHVLEPLSGYLFLAAALRKNPLHFSKAYNFGPLPGDHLKVKELVDIATRLWGSGEWKDISDPGQVHEAGLLKLDITLAMKELGWKPKLNAPLAIAWTIEWYKQPVARQADFSFKQIKDYFAQ
jgi:CDP-glucose 4,6-dehydratase